MAQAIEQTTAQRREAGAFAETKSGNAVLVNTLRRWGVRFFAGMNVVPQLQAELGEGCVVIDDMNRLEDDLRRAQRVLKHNKPVAIAFHPDVLSRETGADVSWTSHPRTFSAQDVAEFLAEFPLVSKGRRVVVYVSGEA